ncbi:MAG: DUF423 domain-containing protein [Acidobacteriota bacterium]
MDRLFLGIGAILGFLAIAAGAFGTHILRARLSTDRLDIFEIAVRYQMYHALALLAVSWLSSRTPSGWAGLAGWLFLVGVLIFSGTLYLVALTGQRGWGAVTPVGGLALLAGWACLIAVAVSVGTKL